MAQLDVSDLLLDPTFVDSLTLIHRTSTVNMYGENVLVETPIATVGSVQPASSRQIQRLPEALRTADIRSFFIRAEILSDGDSQYPDIIVFGGFRYQVMSVAPWLNYGAGWNEGICVREKPAS